MKKAIQTKFTGAELELLLEFGLTKVQAILYLTSLKYGMLTVVELSEKTNINRAQIYIEAEEMIKLGAYDITRKQGRKYIPASPTKLVCLGELKIKTAEESLKKLSEFVPDLEALSSAKKYKTVIRHFEGFDRIKDAYMEELALAKNTEVLALGGSLEHHFEHFPEAFWHKWNKVFVEQKSHSKMIVHDSELARKTAKNDGLYNCTTRTLTPFPLTVNIDVFNNVVLIVSLEDELALWVESAPFAASYKMLFQTLWQFAKPIENT